jgi:hypothetical protein
VSAQPPALVSSRPAPRLTWREVRALSKARFAAELRERFTLRLHVVAILTGTVVAGTLASAAALHAGVESMALRSLLGLGVAYLAFLAFVRLWIAYVQGWRPEPDPADLLDACDLAGDIASNYASRFAAGGGQFGGGGAHGGWGNALPAEAPSGGDSAGFALDLDDGILILLFLAVVVAVLGGLVYFVAIGPGVLTEAAFEVVLAASLARRWGGDAAPGHWLDHVVGATILPFVIVAALTAAFVWFAQGACPEAIRLRDVVECIRA